MLESLSSAFSENPSIYSCICFAGLYAAYYLIYVGKAPTVYCGDKGLRSFIDKYCPVSRKKYWPTWWCIESHAQTLLRAFLQSKPPVDYFEEYLKTPDDGEIVLHWEENDKSSHPKKSRPTILFMPGLTGCSKEAYILHLVHHATDLGYRSVVFNNRGTGDSSLKTARTFCAANTEDAKLVISHIRAKYPESPLVGVGVSLGGIILFNYLANVGPKAEIAAALMISPAYDLHQSCQSLERPINYWMFNRYLASNLCKMIERNLHLFDNHLEIDTAHVLKSETIKDFDTRLTSKMFGFESVDHYYTEASLHTKVHSLSRPVVCLSAADDPFAPEYTIPTKDAEENKNIAIVKTSHGGHIGFLEGMIPRHRSYMYRWFEQFVSAVFEHGIKIE